ncbi:MAG TPA: peptidoglycan endopeptidase [Desulfuromonadales bacterium]|nr:peptidoglycan endopeptidase [Desulfuromonadales bacterium]
MKTLVAILLILLAVPQALIAGPPAFGVVRTPAPVLNSADFRAVFGGGNGRSLKTDRCGQVRELEYIALPGTALTILGELKRGSDTLYRVQIDDYPVRDTIPLFIDSRSVELRNQAPPPRSRTLTDRAEIITALRGVIGKGYVWGGNIPGGIPELAKWYYHLATGDDLPRLTLAGLDCSGLLYHASGGWTPRNTEQLISYGRSVSVAGKSAAAIAAIAEPLDLIVWKGHVIIVLDRETVIESRLECGKPGNGGVTTTPLKHRLREIMRTRRPADVWPHDRSSKDVFVVRRWYGPQ